jgi:hypothetical protein
MKHAEVATLQASFDSLTQSYASTEASFKALQSAHTAQAHQLTQALSKVQGLTGQLAEQEARYSNEASGLKRLVSMMEEREKQAKEIVENIERDWVTVGEKSERREAALKDEIERERRGREESEMRLEQLEGVLERMGRGELPIPGRNTPSTPFRAPGTSDFMVDGMMGLSPTVAMASKSQRTGKTFTEVYADYVRLQEEYAKKSAEYDHMDRTLSSVLAQIEERVRDPPFIRWSNLTDLFWPIRRPSFLNSASNMSVCKQKLRSLVHNLLKPSRTETPRLTTRRGNLRNLPNQLTRMNFCKSNLRILASRSKLFFATLRDAKIRQSPLKRISNALLSMQKVIPKR